VETPSRRITRTALHSVIAGGAAVPENRPAYIATNASPQSVRARLHPAMLSRAALGELADPRWHSFVTRLQALNLTFKGAHHILHKVDEVSFPFGVLPRAPLFDRDVAEAAFALPPTMRLCGAVEKYLLKHAVKDLLPRAIIERPKSGMLVPVEAWFRGPLLPHARSGYWTGSRAGTYSNVHTWSSCSRASCRACGRVTVRRSGCW